jgi:hypothetical protein
MVPILLPWLKVAGPERTLTVTGRSELLVGIWIWKGGFLYVGGKIV